MIIRGINIIFLFFSCSLVICKGQDLNKIYIPLPPQELSVEQYLYHIDQVSPFKLAYSSAIVDDKRIAIYCDSIRLTELLDTLFTSYEIQYIVQGNQLILSPQTSSLEKLNQVRLTGTVCNSRNQRPIPFANVFVPFESTGTITNSDGKFELILSRDHLPDSIIFSCIGYTSSKAYPEEYLTNQIQIALHPYRFQIDELIVRPEDPIKLLLTALENKGDNYSRKPVMQTAFFREVSRQNEKYIGLSEALIDIYKTSYLTEEKDLVRLIKGRRGTNIQESELVNLIVEGGLYNNMQLDIMKYGVSFLDPEYFRHYDYHMGKQLSYNGRQAYIIEFNYKDDLDLPGFNGRLYLDAQSLAIVRAEFSISPESMKHAYAMLVKKVPTGFRIRPKYGNYEVEYRFYEGTWNLNHARSEISLRLHKKRDRKNTGFSCMFTTSSEFVITGQTTSDIEKIKYRDASKPHDVLYEQISNTDLEFWGNETVILPEEPLLKTLEKFLLKETSGGQSLVTTKPE